jgi:tRNA uridine 5-carboxymethylaminomethyl modification enzyme
VDDTRWNHFTQKLVNVREINEYLNRKRVEGKSLAQWIRQQDKDYEWLMKAEPDLAQKNYGKSTLQYAINDIKYLGYVEKQVRLISRFKKIEDRKLPPDLDYRTIPQLRNEARERLNQVQPVNLGQASRITGLTPADITVLMIFMDQKSGIKK